MTLTADQVKTLSKDFTLMQPIANVMLPVPKATTGGDDLSSKLDPVGADKRFTKWGFAVADFTKSVASPRVWVHQPEKPWRTGSTGKIGILLAAAQLRDDVRFADKAGLLKTGADWDAFFARKDLWQPSPVYRSNDIANRGPRISTIFDLSKSPPDFVDLSKSRADFAKAVRKKLTDAGESHLQWAIAKNFTFAERLFLACSLSDNTGATSCLSELGVGYVKAVQRAYGLFQEDAKIGMRLLMSGRYKVIDADTSVNTTGTEKYRGLVDVETHHVTDAMLTGSGAYADQDSWQPGSTAALLAYMIAFRQHKFVPRDAPTSSDDAFKCIEYFLSQGGAGQTHSYIVRGAKKVSKTVIDLQRTKIGLLGVEDLEKGSLNCEFAYLETHQTDAATKSLKYAVVAMGIVDELDDKGKFSRDASAVTEDLGQAIHQALIA